MIVVAHQVVRSEDGLQNQVVFDLGPAVPLAHGDVELVSGRARWVEPEAVVTGAAGVAGNAPIDGDVVLGRVVVEVAEVQTHLVCADIQQLRVPHPRAALVGIDASWVAVVCVGAGGRVRLVHAVQVYPVGGGVVSGVTGDPDIDLAPDFHVAGHRLVELKGPVDGLIAAGGVPLLVPIVCQVPIHLHKPLERVLVSGLEGRHVPHHVVGAVGQVLVPAPLAALLGLELQLGIHTWRDIERVDLRVGVVQ